MGGESEISPDTPTFSYLLQFRFVNYLPDIE